MLKRAIRRMTPRTKNAIFITAYLLCVAPVIVPFFYLAGSGIRPGLLGIPGTVLYWLLDSVLLVVITMALYAFEEIRGENAEVDEGEL